MQLKLTDIKWHAIKAGPYKVWHAIKADRYKVWHAIKAD